MFDIVSTPVLFYCFILNRPLIYIASNYYIIALLDDHERRLDQTAELSLEHPVNIYPLFKTS